MNELHDLYQLDKETSSKLTIEKQFGSMANGDAVWRYKFQTQATLLAFLNAQGLRGNAPPNGNGSLESMDTFEVSSQWETSKKYKMTYTFGVLCTPMEGYTSIQG